MSLSFKPRKELLEDGITQPLEPSFCSANSMDFAGVPFEQQNNSIKLNTLVLTENEKYAVSQVSAPLAFKNPLTNEQSNIQTCTLNPKSGFALVLTKDGFMHIWSYLNKLPLASSNVLSHNFSELLPRSTSTTSLADFEFEFVANDIKLTPGLLIFNKKTGETFYYEDIQCDLSVEYAHQYKITLKANEHIVQHEYIAGAGLMVVTDVHHNRLLLISIKDSLGKPLTACKEQLLNDSSIGWKSFLPKIKSAEIRCLNQEDFLNKTDKSITTLDADGGLVNWVVNRDSHFKNLETNIYGAVVNESLESFYPYTFNGTKFCAFQKITENVYLFVSKVQAEIETLQRPKEHIQYHYIVSVVKGVFQSNTNTNEQMEVLSTYRIKTVVDDLDRVNVFANYSSNNTFFPVFVTFKNSIVILQLSTKFDSFFGFQDKWEDIVSFKPNSENFACTYDKGKLFFFNTYVNQLLKITLKEFNNTGQKKNKKSLHLNSFIKTHIEQSIFFNTTGTANPVEFDLPKHLELKKTDIEHDLTAVVDEVWNSNSSYLPAYPAKTTDPNLVKQYLQCKLNVFERLLSYITQNFNEVIDANLKLSILYKTEIIDCSFVFYDNLTSSAKSSLVTSANSSSLFQLESNLDHFPEKYENFIRNWNGSIASTPSDVNVQEQFVNLVITTLYETVFEKCESHYKYKILNLSSSKESSESLPWFSSQTLMEAINDLVLQYSSLAISKTEQSNENLLKLIKILYYQASQYETLSKCKVFEQNNLKWCDLVIGTHDDSYYRSLILMLDFYNDLKGLVYTFDKLGEEMIPDSVYSDYLKKYGTAFTAEICDYFTKGTGNLSKLFRIFKSNTDPVVKSMLTQYLNGNRALYGNVVWMDDIINENYLGASNALYKLSKDSSKPPKFQAKQFELSLSKLALLYASQDKAIGELAPNVNEQLLKIQTGLYELKAQKELFDKLQISGKTIEELSELDQNSEMYKLAQTLVENLQKTSIGSTDKQAPKTSSDKLEVNGAQSKEKKPVSKKDTKALPKPVQTIESSVTFPVQQLIYLFTVLTKSNTLFEDGCFCALESLSLSISEMEYETFQFCLGFIWRFILYNIDEKKEKKNLVKLTLDKYFEHELYRHIPLPLTTDVYDQTSFRSAECVHEFLQNTHSAVTLHINTQKFIQENVDLLSKVQNDAKIQEFITSELPILINESNAKYGNQVIVNFSNGKLSFIE